MGSHPQHQTLERFDFASGVAIFAVAVGTWIAVQIALFTAGSAIGSVPAPLEPTAASSVAEQAAYALTVRRFGFAISNLDALVQLWKYVNLLPGIGCASFAVGASRLYPPGRARAGLVVLGLVVLFAGTLRAFQLAS